MNRLMTAMGLLIVVAGGPALAQSGASSRSNATTTRSNEAPIGHRQPKAGDVPDEKNLGNPNDQANKEDAALDRKIKSICRGC